MIRFSLVIGLVLLCAVTPAIAQTATKPEVARRSVADKAVEKGAEVDDLAAIRETSQAFTKAFNARDSKAIAELWTKDGEYVDESGKVYSGREAIEKEYAEFFSANKDNRIQIVIDSLRLLSDSAAIEDGRTILEPTSTGRSSTSAYMAVHVKVDGRWLMSTVRDSIGPSMSVKRDLDDLQWLIGTWVADEYGSTTESVCRWIADKSFVERRYVVKHPDGTVTSGLQLIGNNPREGRLQSWNFSSDGGVAVGVWTRRDNGWSAEIEGTTGTGIRTHAINILTRLDDNAYSWQSLARSAGSVKLTDTDEVVLKRQPVTR